MVGGHDSGKSRHGVDETLVVVVGGSSEGEGQSLVSVGVNRTAHGRGHAGLNTVPAAAGRGGGLHHLDDGPAGFQARRHPSKACRGYDGVLEAETMGQADFDDQPPEVQLLATIRPPSLWSFPPCKAAWRAYSAGPWPPNPPRGVRVFSGLHVCLFLQVVRARVAQG